MKKGIPIALVLSISLALVWYGNYKRERQASTENEKAWASQLASILRDAKIRQVPNLDADELLTHLQQSHEYLRAKSFSRSDSKVPPPPNHYEYLLFTVTRERAKKASQTNIVKACDYLLSGIQEPPGFRNYDLENLMREITNTPDNEAK